MDVGFLLRISRFMASEQLNEPSVTSRDMFTYQILRALEILNFDIFLDIDGTEGYTSSLIRSLLKNRVYRCALPQQTQRPAKGVFDIDEKGIDAYDFDSADGQFDGALINERLVHGENFERVDSFAPHPN
jgi:hypothetical protein